MSATRDTPSHRHLAKRLSPVQLNTHLEFDCEDLMPSSYDPALLAQHYRIHRSFSHCPSHTQLTEVLKKLLFQPNRYGYEMEVFKRQSSKCLPLMQYHIKAFKDLFNVRRGARGFFPTDDLGVFKAPAADPSEWDLVFCNKPAPALRLGDATAYTTERHFLHMSRGGVTEELSFCYKTDHDDVVDCDFCLIDATIKFVYADGHELCVHTDGDERNVAHVLYSRTYVPINPSACFPAEEPSAPAPAEEFCVHTLRLTYACQMVPRGQRTELGQPLDKVLIAMLATKIDGSWRLYCPYGAPRPYTAMPYHLLGYSGLTKPTGMVFRKAQLKHRERWEREAKEAHLRSSRVPAIAGDNGAFSGGWDTARLHQTADVEAAFDAFMECTNETLVDEKRNEVAELKSHKLFTAGWIAYNQKFRVPEPAAKRRRTA